MIYPDGVVEDEMAVSLSPVVADAVFAVDDEGFDTEHFQGCGDT
jgi:hypothetical protein